MKLRNSLVTCILVATFFLTGSLVGATESNVAYMVKRGNNMTVESFVIDQSIKSALVVLAAMGWQPVGVVSNNSKYTVLFLDEYVKVSRLWEESPRCSLFISYIGDDKTLKEIANNESYLEGEYSLE